MAIVKSCHSSATVYNDDDYDDDDDGDGGDDNNDCYDKADGDQVCRLRISLVLLHRPRCSR